MKDALKNMTRTVLVVAALAFGFVALAAPVYAVDTKAEICKGIKDAGGNCSDSGALPAFIQQIINILLFITGAIAVIMIILGGIRYVTSNGDQADVKAAKDTILYAVIGLVVAALAYAIVNFIVGHL